MLEQPALILAGMPTTYMTYKVLEYGYNRIRCRKIPRGTLGNKIPVYQTGLRTDGEK